MARIEGAPGAAGTQFRRVLGHRPEVARQWAALDEALRFEGTLAPELKEQVRRALAQHSGCAFCASLGEPDEQSHDEVTRAAIRFALAVNDGAAAVGDDAFDTLQRHFSTPQQVELMAWICFMHASEQMGALFRLAPASAQELRGYEAWLTAGFRRAQRQVQSAAPASA